MSRKATYEAQREVRTYVDLYHASSALAERAENEPKGRTFTTMGALVLCAFTFEAYLNHLGEGPLNLWSKKDFINVWVKYDMVCKYLKISPDFSRRPHRTLIELFKLRDLLAHGRSENLTAKKTVGLEYDPPPLAPKAPWERRLTLGFCKRAMEDLSKVVKQMHVAADLGNSPFVQGIGSYAIKQGSTVVGG